METKFLWTVYIGGRLFDLLTDSEVEEIIQVWKVVLIDSKRGLIEF